MIKPEGILNRNIFVDNDFVWFINKIQIAIQNVINDIAADGYGNGR